MCAHICFNEFLKAAVSISQKGLGREKKHVTEQKEYKNKNKINIFDTNRKNEHIEINGTRAVLSVFK